MAYFGTDPFENDTAQGLAIGLRDLLLKKASKSKDFGEARAARVLLSALVEAFPDIVTITDEDYLLATDHLNVLFSKLRGEADLLREMSHELHEEALDFEDALEAVKAHERGEEDEAEEDDEESEEEGETEDECE